MAKPTKTTDREIRVRGELRMDGAGEDRKIVGHAAVFNSPTDIGGMFREQIAPGAFALALGRDDVRALVDHDSSMVLGRTKSKTLRLEEDNRGLAVEIDLPDTQAARDLIVSMERGDVDQMSFAFRALKQEWDDTQDPPLRTITEAELFDVSVVTFPAYDDATAAVRSLEGVRADASKDVMRRKATNTRRLKLAETRM